MVIPQGKSLIVIVGIFVGSLTLQAQDPSLHLAAASGNVSEVEVLINAGVDINGTMTGGNTPLMVSAKFDQIDAMKVLLDNNARINLTNQKGNTALIVAVTAKRIKAVELLVTRNANISIKNKDGLDARDIARMLGYTEILKLLTPNG